MDSIPNTPLTVEQLLLVISVLFIPAGGCVYWIASKISKLESQIESLTEVKKLEHNVVLTRVEQLERHVHEIRNVLQTLTLAMVRSGITVDKHDSR